MKKLIPATVTTVVLSWIGLSLTQSQPLGLLSFLQVRERVFANPLPSLPRLKGASTGTLLATALGIHTKLFKRARAIFSEPVDFKDSPRVKLFHPMGVCADGVWTIHHTSPFTGLFAQGTRVPAIVRLSTGTDQTTYKPGKTRLFGIALKLFAAEGEDIPAATANLNFLDQSGLDGDDRPNYFGPFSQGGPVHFRNEGKGHGFAIDLLNRAFKAIDIDPTRRPTRPLAAIDGSGLTIAEPKAPVLLELTPSLDAAIPAPVGADFRTELLAYPPNSISFSVSGDGQALGTLELSQTVVSTACDQELQFVHARN